MNERLASICRGIAWAIVVLAVTDPAVPMRSQVLPEIALVTDGTDPATAAEAGGRLERLLADKATLVRSSSDAPAASVLIARRYRPDLVRFPDKTAVHVIAVSPSRPFAIEEVSAPGAVPLRVPVRIDVRLSDGQGQAKSRRNAEREGRGQGQGQGQGRSTLTLLDRDVAVARAEVRWTPGQQHAESTLVWVPTRTGATRLRIVAERAGASERADVLVLVTDEAVDVRVQASRPSWAAMFADRALRDDPRLRVASRIATAPGRAVATSPGPDLSPTRISDVIVVGAVDVLQPREAELLRREASGGAAIVLVPDRTLGATAQVLAGISNLREHIQPKPVKASNGLRASEWLEAGGINPASRVLASAEIAGRARPVVIETPLGTGTVVVVGAMDAWRFRADRSFERFWRSLVVELAADRRLRRAMGVKPAVAKPGETLEIRLPRGSDRTSQTVTIRMERDGREVDRLTLVRTRDGSFAGIATAPGEPGLYALRPDAEDWPGAAVLVAEDAATPTDADEVSLRTLAAARGGTFARGDDPEEIEALATAIADASRPRQTTRLARAMRWPGWGVMFATLLSADWWIRRRRGLR